MLRTKLCPLMFHVKPDVAKSAQQVPDDVKDATETPGFSSGPVFREPLFSHPFPDIA